MGHASRASPRGQRGRRGSKKSPPGRPSGGEKRPSWGRIKGGEDHDTVGVGAARAPDAILVDRVGVLADLYGLATVAYVGGGFHGDGLHSVLEPAAVGVPVLIGPRYHGSVHATRLLAAGGARVVTDADVLARTLLEWIGAPEKREAHGRRAMDYIENHRGSAERTAGLITRILPQEIRRGTLSEGEM